jgi:Na+-translocating ferredoxin:NAD+ oxidoreductase RnfD subunit
LAIVASTGYPVVLPSIKDARLHLAAVIISLQVLGQVAFDFDLSIAQILIAIGTCAILELAIVFRQQRIIMWPASALLTGNGVAFVLRVPGTQPGDWWSLHGWWIFAGTAAVALLSKYVLRLRREHIFNPSNIGLVLCFLILGPGQAEPLDFWWGPMDAWMAIALAIIVVGGLAILTRLKILIIAVGFWLSFAAATGVLALSGHAMTARWHLGEITGVTFWRILITSPEILVFLFFMITDPKTSPKTTRARLVYSVSIALLATLLIAAARTEYWSKVAVLGALAVICLVRALYRRFAPDVHLGRKWALAVVAGVALAYTGALYAAGIPARPHASPYRYRGPLPKITILRSKGGLGDIGRKDARRVVRDAMTSMSDSDRVRLSRVEIWLVLGTQAMTPVVRLFPQGVTVKLGNVNDHYVIPRGPGDGLKVSVDE